MFLILSTINAKQQLNSIYNDYDLAYLGKEFSEAFKAWNYDFHHGMTPILYGAFTSMLPSGSYQYAYDECTITYTSYVLRGNIYVAVIQDYRFNRELLEDVREETQIERTRIGMGSSTATTTVSRMRVNDYIELKDYGTLFGNQVVLVKRKGIKPNKRQLFNYKLYPKNGGTPYIMYSQDFYSANPFEDNIATAWGTDGHKYELYSRRRMRMVESKKHINQIITEVINQNTTNEFVSVSEFKYKGKELYNVGDGDSFAYLPCDIYGTPKLYYADCHSSCAVQALDDIINSFNGGRVYDLFDTDEDYEITEELWLDCCSERGRVYFEKYIVVGEDGHIPSSEYVSKVIEYMGGSPKDYSVLYNESNTVKEISVDLFLKSGISGKKKPTKLSVPKKLKEVYERVVNRRYAADRKFPTNMTRAEYYWLTIQENRKINKIVIETINQYLKQNLILN